MSGRAAGDFSSLDAGRHDLLVLLAFVINAFSGLHSPNDRLVCLAKVHNCRSTMPISAPSRLNLAPDRRV